MGERDDTGCRYICHLVKHHDVIDDNNHITGQKDDDQN
jgi:hypothetical protein